MLNIVITLSTQQLFLYDDGLMVANYWVSTAAKGPGEQWGSEQTPRGNHIIRAKIGAGAPMDAVFVGRRQTGECYSPALAAQYPARDWILTRILWLSGKDVGSNRLGNVDTMRRMIYIHGTPDTVPMGVPGSHGCIRMRNADLVALFDRVPAGCPVSIVT